MRELLDDIEVRVLQNTVKIPMILVVPALLLISLYAIVYLLANTSIVHHELERFLSGQPGADNIFDGQVRVRELVVDANLQRAHVYGVTLDDVDGFRVIEAREIHASFNLLKLLHNKLWMESGQLVGARVHMKVGHDGELNLLSALGIKSKPDGPADGGGGLEVHLHNVSAHDSVYTLTHPLVEIHVPVVNIPGYELHVANDTVKMDVAAWDAPEALFRFNYVLFDAVEKGDWTIRLQNFSLRGWSWRPDTYQGRDVMGFMAQSVRGEAEGVELEARGKILFIDHPDDVFAFDAEGTVRVPFWTTLLNYFTEDKLHLDAPRIWLKGKGTLNTVEAMAEAHVRYLEATGVTVEDIHAKATLHDQMLMIHEGEARFHEGRIKITEGFFTLFEKFYGMRLEVDGINPGSVLREMGAEQPVLEGRLTGALELHGRVPRGLLVTPQTRYAALSNAQDKWVTATLTQDATLERYNRELLPQQQLKILQGSQVSVDLERAWVPGAWIRAGGRDWVELDGLVVDYTRMEYIPWPVKGPARLVATLGDLGLYARHFGYPQVRSGSAVVEVRAEGPVVAPWWTTFVGEARDIVLLDKVVIDRAVGRALLDRDGVVNLETLVGEVAGGVVQMSGRVGQLVRRPVASVTRPQNRPADVFFQRPRRLVDIKAEARGVELEQVAAPFIPQSALPKILRGQTTVRGKLAEASMWVRGELEAPWVCAEGRVKSGVLMGEPLAEAYARVSWRARGAGRRACEGHGPLVPGYEAAVLDRLELVHREASGADGGRGVLLARAAVGGRGELVGEVETRGLEVGRLGVVRRQPVSLEAVGDMLIKLGGSVSAPLASGFLKLDALRAQGLDAGQLGLVLHSEMRPMARGGEAPVWHVAGALLPWLTLEGEVPFDVEEPLYMRLGAESLDVLEMVRRTGLAEVLPQVGRLASLRRVRVAGAVDVFRYQDRDELTVALNLSDVEVGAGARALRNREPVAIGYNAQQGASQITIDSLSMGTSKRALSVRGAVRPEEGLIDLDASGTLDLAWVWLIKELMPELLPASFVDAAGAVGLKVAVRGAPSGLGIDGEIAWQPSEFVLRGLPDTLQIRGGRIDFTRDRAIIPEEAPMVGSVLGGTYSLYGHMALVDFLPRDMDMRFWSHNMSYVFTDMASVTVDTEMRLRASEPLKLGTWRVSGAVDILDGVFFQNISVFEKQLTGRVLGAFQRKAEAYQSTLVEQMPELEETQFELMVRARDGFRVRNQIERFGLDLELRMELLFSNTLAVPRLQGDVEVLGGTVIFQGEQFRMRNGIVRFNGAMENPYIDVVAGADIRNTCTGNRTSNTFTQALTMSTGGQNADIQRSFYHISLNVRGSLDGLNILYESVPYADQRDVISLILTGCTVDQLTASSASQPTLELALGPLIGRLEREIQDVIKVEEFTIMPGVEVTQLRISDRITRALSWNFQLDTGLSEATRGQFFQLEYALTDQWAAQLAESTRTENNQFMIDLRLKYHLPLD
jgi:hypothetical protein